MYQSDTQYRHGGSTTICNSSSRHSMDSSDLCRHCMICTNVHVGKPFIYIKEKNLKKKKPRKEDRQGLCLKGWKDGLVDRGTSADPQNPHSKRTELSLQVIF